MSDATFEAALSARTAAMADACVRCGKCVEACPSVAPAGLGGEEPVAVVDGVLDLIRGGQGSDAGRRWASACMLSGDCIKACDYGVNPRFLLAMARLAAAQAKTELPQRRRQAIDAFRQLGRDVHVLSRLQLTPEQLERLGQSRRGGAPKDDDAEPPDFVFYTGCNVLKTPQIALLAVDIMDALGATYRVLGGPSHCCGVNHLRAGDVEAMDKVAGFATEKMARSKTGQVITWCPSCFVQFTETTLPTIERQSGARPFEMTPFLRFVHARIDDLRSLLQKRLPLKVALHKHPGVPGVVEAAEALLGAIPGVELVDLHQPAIGLQSVTLRSLPEMKRQVQRRELEAAAAAGIDALAAVYHSDHRELCAHERDWPFRIVNVLELVGASMGISEDDHYKRLKMMQDTDAILDDCRDLIAEYKLDADEARAVVAKGMLADQPLPLGGKVR